MSKKPYSILALFLISMAWGANAHSDDSYGCIGIAVESQQGVIFVKEDLPNSPALDAGMAAGDVILDVQKSSDTAAVPVAGKTLEETVEMIRGPVGTPVTLDVLRDGETLAFTMIREVIPSN